MKFQTPKGTRDFLPDEAEKMQRMIDVVRSVFEKYGFQPLFTPVFESFELLSAKGGLGEAVKDEIYYFKDKSDRELGLRFDLTMPLARVVASNPQLQKPIKRYVIDRVWRYDNPQKLRYREFWQADIDVVGSKSLLADAECVSAVCECMEKLGFKNFYIRINNRKLVQNIFEKFLDKNKVSEAFRTIDKLDKIGLDGVKKELENKKIDSKKILEIIKINGSNKEILQKLKREYSGNEGLDELEELLNYAKDFGIENRLKIDLSLVRGLDYYTGLVFEVYTGAYAGSEGGGGRYDNLIKNISGFAMPATGISLGLSRLFELMKNENSEEKKSVFVARVNDDVLGDVVEIIQKLRSEGIVCRMELMERNLSKQLEYANSIGASYVVVVGPEEVKKKKFKLKDMKKKTEKELMLKDIIKLLI